MTTLLDHLQEQGYDPREDIPHDSYDLTASGIGTVRVCIYPRDDWRIEVYAFDGHMNCEWQAGLSPGTPQAVILAVIEAAEWELARKRGGPVTPAQAATL